MANISTNYGSSLKVEYFSFFGKKNGDEKTQIPRKRKRTYGAIGG